MVQWCWVNFKWRGFLPISLIVGQGPIALVVDAGGGCLLSSIISLFFLPLSGTALYRLLKGLLNPKQPINQPTNQLLSGRHGPLK